MTEQDKKLDIEAFYKEVKKHLKDGMEYADAVRFAGVILGGEIARLVSPAVNKYQEAIYEKTELSKQENVDECALASMGKLWHGEHFEGSSAQMECTQEESFLDALYLVLKYAKSKNPLKEALRANDSICGDKIARKKMIEMAFGDV
jgi:hypothetical protein